MQKKRKTKVLIMAIAAGCLIVSIGLGACTMTNLENERLYHAVRSHVHEYGESTVVLGDLTDFDWDQSLFFSYTNPGSIYEAIGVNFQKTDLTIGIIFVRDGEIVYYELFHRDYSGISPLPSRFSMLGATSLTIFEQDDIFGVGSSGPDDRGGIRYWIRPQE